MDYSSLSTITFQNKLGNREAGGLSGNLYKLISEKKNKNKKPSQRCQVEL